MWGCGVKAFNQGAIMRATAPADPGTDLKTPSVWLDAMWPDCKTRLYFTSQMQQNEAELGVHSSLKQNYARLFLAYQIAKQNVSGIQPWSGAGQQRASNPRIKPAVESEKRDHNHNFCPHKVLLFHPLVIIRAAIQLLTRLFCHAIKINKAYKSFCPKVQHCPKNTSCVEFSFWQGFLVIMWRMSTKLLSIAVLGTTARPLRDLGSSIPCRRLYQYFALPVW